MSIFKDCDIRGVVGEDWSSKDAFLIGCSLGGILIRRGESEICIGGDFRRTTQELKNAIIEGLMATGISIFDVGLGPTPMSYFATKHLQSTCFQG